MKNFIKGNIIRVERNKLIRLFIISIFIFGFAYGFSDTYSRFALLLALALAVILIWRITKIIKCLKKLEEHPILKTMAEYGDPKTIQNKIDNEIQQGVIAKEGAIWITRNWILKKEKYHLVIIPIEQLVWVFLRETWFYINFLPYGWSYSVALVSQNGEEITVKLPKKKADKLIKELFFQFQNVIFGFYKKLDNLWKNNRNEFCHRAQDLKEFKRWIEEEDLTNSHIKWQESQMKKNAEAKF